VCESAEETAERIARELGATACVGPEPRLDRTRAFVKVQDGCTFGCAFCVIPRVRGASRSRPLRAVLDEARRRIAQGHRELVVTGVNLGLYRDADARARLPEVLSALAELDGLGRVRLSSIEVNHLSGRLCDALAHPRICPHLHVPLQSGDDGVLRAMRRRYDLATYARRVERARAAVPGLNLTGDVIVGFPGEDAAAFARTLAAVEELGFSRLHVFPYSPRPGTRTAGADPVPPAVKRRRAERLRALSDRLGYARRAARVGVRDRVLVERVDADGRLHGYGADYTAYELRSHAGAGVGDLVEVVLESPGERAAQGRVL
jgi:threonylcarbamoyladenosine tRNA methylthiotransferase MtaB